MSAARPSSITRRRFLRDTSLALAAASSSPVLSAPFASRAMADTKTLTIVQWSHFVPAYDKWFDKFASDWGEKNHIQVSVDHIPVQDVAVLPLVFYHQPFLLRPSVRGSRNNLLVWMLPHTRTRIQR